MVTEKKQTEQIGNYSEKRKKNQTEKQIENQIENPTENQTEKQKNQEKKAVRIEHPIPPLYREDSCILILGSFPSVKSRENRFFYGHPQNRFWKMIWELEENCPYTGQLPDIEAKKTFLYRNRLAMWDVIQSCDIIGSSDSSIKNAVPTNLKPILDTCRIEKILTNGDLAWKLYEKYTFPATGIHAIKCPSTSPANAAWTMEQLKEAWGKEILFDENKRTFHI